MEIYGKEKMILLDKTEAVFFFRDDKGTKTYNIEASSITRIQFDKCQGRKFGIIPTESEKITIFSPKSAEPLVYLKDKHKAFFEDYKADLTKFAKENRVTLQDNTK